MDQEGNMQWWLRVLRGTSQMSQSAWSVTTFTMLKPKHNELFHIYKVAKI